MKKDVDYNRIAEEVMFLGKLSLTKHNVTYRKNKDSKDVVEALKKALRNGNGKTENEISMLEIYLKDVLKKAR